MSGFVDTSVLVRYLMDDFPAMAEESARIVETRDKLRVTADVLAETAHVLTSFYQAPREAPARRWWTA